MVNSKEELVFLYVSPYETLSEKGQNIFEQGLLRSLIRLADQMHTTHFEILSPKPFFWKGGVGSNVSISQIPLIKFPYLGHLYFQCILFLKLIALHIRYRRTRKVMYLRYHPALFAPLLVHIAFRTSFIMRTGPVLPNLSIYKKNPPYIIFKGIELVMGLFARRAKRIITVTAKIAEWVVSTFGVSNEKLCIVANGVDTDIFVMAAEDAKAWGLDRTKVKVGFVGHIYEDQGIATVLEAIAHLSSDVRERLEFLIVGDGPDLASLKQLAEDLGVSGQTRFVGKVPFARVPSAIASCDYMLAPFTKRTFTVTGSSALKIYEALSCNKPLIASRGPDHEFLHENNLGLLVEAENVLEWAKTLESVIKNAPSFSSGRSYVQKHHSYEKIAREIYALAVE